MKSRNKFSLALSLVISVLLFRLTVLTLYAKRPTWQSKHPEQDTPRIEKIGALNVPDRAISLIFTSDSNLLAYGALDGTIGLWNTTTASKEVEIWKYIKPGYLALSPNDNILAVGTELTVMLLDVTKELAKITHLSCYPKEVAADIIISSTYSHADVNCIHFTPDGQVLVALARSHTLEGNDRLIFWDISTKSKIDVLEGEIDDCSLSPDGKILATVDSNVRLWDMTTKKQIGIIEPPTNPYTVDFSPNGKLLASEVGDKVIVWDVSTRRKVATLWLSRDEFQYHTYPLLNYFIFAPNSKFIATSYNRIDNKIEIVLWNISKEETVAQMTIDGYVWSMAFSPDGKILATGLDRTIKLWDVENIIRLERNQNR